MKRFEYDAIKSQTNRDKHGIDFESAQALWDDPAMVELHAKSVSESRRMVIGSIDDRIWTAIITYRKSVIRIISVRRARKDEVAEYES